MKQSKMVVTMKFTAELVMNTEEMVAIPAIGDVLARVFANRPEMMERIQGAIEEATATKAAPGYSLYFGLERVSQRRRIVDSRERLAAEVSK